MLDFCKLKFPTYSLLIITLELLLSCYLHFWHVLHVLCANRDNEDFDVPLPFSYHLPINLQCEYSD